MKRVMKRKNFIVSIPEVIQALFDVLRNRDGDETAVLMAAMLLYVHGISDDQYFGAINV